MPTWWSGSFRGVYLGGTLATPGVERRVPYWWLTFPELMAWDASFDDLVYPLRVEAR